MEVYLPIWGARKSIDWDLSKRAFDAIFFAFVRVSRALRKVVKRGWTVDRQLFVEASRYCDFTKIDLVLVGVYEHLWKGSDMFEDYSNGYDRSIGILSRPALCHLGIQFRCNYKKLTPPFGICLFLLNRNFLSCVQRTCGTSA